MYKILIFGDEGFLVNMKDFSNIESAEKEIEKIQQLNKEYWIVKIEKKYKTVCTLKESKI